jgi:hypothetical protein
LPATAVGSKFGVGSQFGEKLLVWVSSVTPNWALTPILRAIGHTFKAFAMGPAVYMTNWPLDFICKALAALDIEAIRAVP